MKIIVDGLDVFELTETQKKVIKNEIPDDIFEADMKRRLNWVLMHKYECCFSRFRKEWETKLADAGVTSLPVNKDEFANLVFARPEYKSRQKREQDQLDAVNAKRLENDPSANPLTLAFTNPELDPFMPKPE